MRVLAMRAEEKSWEVKVVHIPNTQGMDMKAKEKKNGGSLRKVGDFYLVKLGGW